jgi:beta-phosphoglucomutase-like phosphatase (HAD superfamily)
MVLFDLGGTLEADGVLRPGAHEVLTELSSLRTGGRPAVVLGLLSDFHMPAEPADVPEIVASYHALLDDLGIRRFFEPLARRVTLSTEVGVRKPAPAMFRAAVARAEPMLAFEDVLFVTEHSGHVRAARQLGMAGVHLRPPGEDEGEVAELLDVLPIAREFVLGASVQRRGAGAAAAAPEGAWTMLGHDVVVTGDATSSGLPSPPIDPSRSGAVRVHVGTAERLFLVTQNGRLFQLDHPEVPVVVDTGRNLVVDLEPEAAQRLEGSGAPAGWCARFPSVRWSCPPPRPTDAGRSWTGSGVAWTASPARSWRLTWRPSPANARGTPRATPSTPRRPGPQAN